MPRISKCVSYFLTIVCNTARQAPDKSSGPVFCCCVPTQAPGLSQNGYGSDQRAAQARVLCTSNGCSAHNCTLQAKDLHVAMQTCCYVLAGGCNVCCGKPPQNRHVTLYSGSPSVHDLQVSSVHLDLNRRVELDRRHGPNSRQQALLPPLLPSRVPPRARGIRRNGTC